jgi:hypothetical protein
VQHQAQARRRVERLAVHAHGVGRQLVVGVQHIACGIGDAPFAEQPCHVLAAAVAEVGQIADQFHRAFLASTTL